MTIAILVLLTLLIALLAADVWLTAKILGQAGRELNKVMRRLMDWLGVVPALVLSKLAIVAILLFILWLNGPGVAYLLMLVVGIVIMLLVVVHNAQQLK